MTHGHRKTYTALVQALRAEFSPSMREMLWFEMREHRYDVTPVGILAQACHDAEDRNYETGEADPWV